MLNNLAQQIVLFFVKMNPAMAKTEISMVAICIAVGGPASSQAHALR